jgi:hypothetical protein
MSNRSLAIFVAGLSIVSICASAPAQLKGDADDPQSAALRMAQWSDRIEKYLFVVDHFARLSDNPTASGIAAALQVDEILKDKPQDQIDYFNRTLPDVKNDSVRRVIRLKLAELYRRTNQPDKALEQIRELMILAPAGAPHVTHVTTTTHPPATHGTRPPDPAPADQ